MTEDYLWGVKQATCRECGVSGQIRIGKQRGRSGKRKVIDSIPHLKTCTYFDRQLPLHLKRKGWRKQEKRANALVGARDTLASGAVGKDGDGRKFNEWRVESKQSASCNYRLTQVVWEKLVKGALLTGEEPILHLELNVTNTPVYRFVVVRRDFYEGVSNDLIGSDGSRRNRLSYRLTADMPTPLLIELDPYGVVVTEAAFERMKEKMDE